MPPYLPEDRMTSLAEAAARLGEVLRHSVEIGEVPGVVAMASNDRGVIYEAHSGRGSWAAPSR
jgi:hypothetical protein